MGACICTLTCTQLHALLHLLRAAMAGQAWAAQHAPPPLLCKARRQQAPLQAVAAGRHHRTLRVTASKGSVSLHRQLVLHTAGCWRWWRRRC